jgi:hypothetical protein
MDLMASAASGGRCRAPARAAPAEGEGRRAGSRQASEDQGRENPGRARHPHHKLLVDKNPRREGTDPARWSRVRHARAYDWRGPSQDEAETSGYDACREPEDSVLIRLRQPGRIRRKILENECTPLGVRSGW